MGQDFFGNLPPEIIIDILSRLPIPSIKHCKCVCKSWLHLLVSHQFVKTHLSKSVPGMAVRCSDSAYCSGCSDWADLNWCEIFEFEDGLDLERHELHYNLVTKFDVPYRGCIEGSVNGLLLLRDIWSEPHALFIYNPITHDYIELDCPHDFVNKLSNFGFGVSQIGGQYKVVRISHDHYKDERIQKWVKNPKCECHVYTLGTRSWRSIELSVQLHYSACITGAIFLNGNLHWLARDLNDSTWISCFDLETELFSTFSVPPLPTHKELHRVLSALGDCLCLCENTSEGELVIWLMKEYGDDKSWTKEFVIKKCRDYYDVWNDNIYPVKVFKDGDLLIGWELFTPVYFSNKTRTINEMKLSELRSDGSMDIILHTSSFVSLKSFPIENVRSF